MATWHASAALPVQFQKSNGQPASGWWLRFEEAGTTNDILMATDAAGGTQLTKAELDDAGYPNTVGGAIFVPHLAETYRPSLYPTEADADAKTNREWPSLSLIPIPDLATDSIASANVTYTSPGSGSTVTTSKELADNQPIDPVAMFGVDNTGASDATAAMLLATEAGKAQGRAVQCPPGTYLFTTGSIFTGVTLAQEAAGGKGLKGLFGAGTDLTIFKFENSGLPAIENTGGRYQNFRDFTVEGSVTNPPNLGLLKARVDRDTGTGNAPSAGEGWMQDIEIRGFFTVAAYYNYGSEVSRMDRVTFENRQTNAPHTIVVTDTNVLNVTSPNSQIAGTTFTNRQQSSIGHYFNQAQIFDYTASSSSDSGVLISGGKSVHFNEFPNYTMFNGVTNSQFFELDQDSANSGLVPQDVRIRDSFYHESAGQVAVFCRSTVQGFSHVNNRGADGGIVFAAGVTLNGEPGNGEHNVLQAEKVNASASTGTLTVVDYTQLSGVTVTISGLSITEVVVTEGSEWTAATSNTATATSLAAAIEAETGLTSSSAVAVVTVNPSPSTGIITSMVSSDDTNLTDDLARVSLLGRTDVYVDDSFEISNFLVGNLFIPDGGLTTLRIGDEPNFKAGIFYQDGIEARPCQGWVKSHNTGDATNVTGDATEYTVLFATEIKNTQNEMVSPTFTAKYNGRYLVAGSVKLGNMNADTYELVTVKINTSNRTYFFTQNGLTYDSNNFLSIPFTCIADMDAADTMTITVIVAGGTKSVTVIGSATAGQTWLDVSFLG